MAGFIRKFADYSTQETKIAPVNGGVAIVDGGERIKYPTLHADLAHRTSRGINFNEEQAMPPNPV
jgi:hypothetical protein